VLGDAVSRAWQEPLGQWGDDECLGVVDTLLAQGDHDRVFALLKDAPDTPLIHIGRAQARVAADRAWAAVADMERLHASEPDNPVVARYLAAFLLAAADQSRGMTRDGRLVVTNERQLAACETAGYRILDLDVPAELLAAGQHLVELAAEGRVWTWRNQRSTVVRLVAAMVAGMAAVVVGGVTENIVLVVAGIVVGAGLVAWLVLWNRRPAWRTTAEEAVIRRPGLADR
jgi:hypothetical protein